MDGLELHMRKRCLDQWWRLGGRRVQETLECGQQLGEHLGRRRYKMRKRRRRAADPDLACAKLPRLLAGTASAMHQQRMHLADQSQRQRKIVFAQALEAMIERSDVVGYLLDIIERHARRLVQFV